MLPRNDAVLFEEFIAHTGLSDEDARDSIAAAASLQNVIAKFVDLGVKPEVISADDPAGGLSGYVIFASAAALGQENEVSFNPQARVFETPTEIECKNASVMIGAYDEARENKWLIYNVNNTIKLSLGFVVVNSDGAKLYTLRLSKWKEWNAMVRRSYSVIQ